MACPYFLPARRLDLGDWIRSPRLPLGDPYAGACHARPGDIVEPPEARQRELCNCGYARGRCDRFPGDSAADAIRFSVTGDDDGLIRLVYIVERDHAPAEHATLEYAVAEARLDGPPTSDLLARQAQAFLESYLRRRTE
ncbi:MAG: hypothetical protein ACRD5L_00500 [Bryobacteraceae bacterium]